MDRRLLDYQPLLEALGPSEFEREAGRTGDEEGPPFSANAELRLAAELLLATDDRKLRAFLRGLIAAIGIDGGRGAGTPLASALVTRLAQVGQPVLRPLRGIALGRGAHGSAMRAARILGLELEGLSPEDQEFALARQFVRFAGAAARAAIRGQGATPAVVARALRAAAEEYAPGLLAGLDTRPPCRNCEPDARASGTFAVLPFSRERIMHDIDRTTMEFGQGTGFEAEQFEFGGQGEWSGEGGLLSEQEEMELTNELLGVNNEQELEQFLGGLFRKVVDVGRQIIPPQVVQAVGGVLKGVAKKALPLAGGAIGGYFGGPLGAKIGSGLASAAGGALGLEAEAQGEDREFEGARQFVRLATDAIQKAAQAPGGDPRAIAQNAALAAARQFAPGLLARTNGAGSSSARQMMGQPMMGQQGVGQQGTWQQGGGARRHGRWARQGNNIVLYGI